MGITSRATLMQNLAKGQGYNCQFVTVGPGNTTAAALASGSHSLQIHWNTIGTTLPATLTDFKLPPSLANQLLFVRGQLNNTINTVGLWLARFYKIGTLALSTTGDKLTHDAATFPVLRTQFGEASKPVSLLPIVNITTATTTTPAVLSLKTAAGVAGYVNQDGTSVVGTASNFTMPAAATTVNSAFFLRLNSGDSGVRDISAIQVNTAASAGAATVYGAELIAPFPMVSDQTTYVVDAVFGGLAMMDLAPAVATTGTVTSFLALLSIGNTSSGLHAVPTICGVLNV